jgi:hypothetical protein
MLVKNYSTEIMQNFFSHKEVKIEKRVTNLTGKKEEEQKTISKEGNKLKIRPAIIQSVKVTELNPHISPFEMITKEFESSGMPVVKQANAGQID